MRLVLRVLPLLLLVLACTKSTISPAVRLDFVGSGRFTSSSRLANPGDTLASKIYAQVGDTSSTSTDYLTNIKIQVTSSPTRTPVIYPASQSAYKPVADTTLVYLDSTFTSPVKDLVFTNLLSARTTSGIDLWEYTITNNNGQTASRAYRLALHRTDSAAVVHSYQLYLSPVPYQSNGFTPAQNRAFAYVGLRQGLLLPHFAVVNKSAHTPNRSLINLVCIATGTDIRLASTASKNIFSNLSNITELRSTTLNIGDFSTFKTNILIEPAFNQGTPYSAAPGFSDAYVTAPLVKGDVIAFLITNKKDGTRKYGALLITDLVRTPTAVVTCQVVVEK